MATDRNVYELVHEQRLYTETFQNVYYYQIAPAVAFNAQDLVTAWQTDVMPAITAAQPPACATSAVRARNLFDVTEFAEDLLNVPGTLAAAGDELPPFVAAAFTLERDTGITRNGKKRIYVGGEGFQDAGSWLGGILAALDALEDALFEIVTVGLTSSFFPVIVKRILDGDTYRLPATQAEADVNGVVGAIYSGLLSTQNSRKYGVGM